MDLNKAYQIKNIVSDIDIINSIIEELESAKEKGGDVIIKFPFGFDEVMPKDSIGRFISFMKDERERIKSLLDTM